MEPPSLFWLLFSLFDVMYWGAEMYSVINCQREKMKYNEHIQDFVWHYSSSS